MPKSELSRLVRHLVVPLVAYLVGRGWIPAELEQPVIELLIMGAGLAGVIFWSRKHEKARAVDSGHGGGEVGFGRDSGTGGNQGAGSEAAEKGPGGS